jgi:hypothetical protein
VNANFSIKIELLLLSAGLSTGFCEDFQSAMLAAPLRDVIKVQAFAFSIHDINDILKILGAGSSLEPAKFLDDDILSRGNSCNHVIE